MNVEILSPDAHIYSGDADLVTLPGATGSFQIKNNHAALISSLQAGEVIVQHGADSKSFQVNGGLIEVVKNKVTILV